MRGLKSKSPSETQALAEKLGRLVAAGDVIELVGPLGAGKTAFVQGLARGVGVAPEVRVTSPTFNIAIEYAGRLPLYHLDLYRLADVSELAEIGFDHYVYGAGVAAVEWLDKFPSLAPADRLTITLAFDPSGGTESRTISVEAHGARAAKLAADVIG